jgi:hypothetical protein
MSSYANGPEKYNCNDYNFMFVPYPEYFHAVKKWGEKSQVAHTIEEMCELQRAIVKYYEEEGRFNKDNLVEELADGIIVLGQIRVIFETDAKFRSFRYDVYKAGYHMSMLNSILYEYYEGNVPEGKLRKRLSKVYAAMASVMQTFHCRDEVERKLEERVEELNRLLKEGV